MQDPVESKDSSECSYLALDLVLLVGEAAQDSAPAGLAGEEAAGVAAEVVDVGLALFCQPVVQPAKTRAR